MSRKNKRKPYHRRPVRAERYMISYKEEHRDRHPKEPERGDIWFARLGNRYDTSLQSGYRPVLVISNDSNNIHSGNITVLPMTTKLKKLYLPGHVVVLPGEVEDRVTSISFETSMVMAEQITTIPKAAIRSFVGSVDEDCMSRVDDAVMEQLGM